MTERAAVPTRTVETNIPARMDRLPWVRWHWLVVVALGITWILDGLEVTIVGAVGGVLNDPRTLHLSAAEVGLLGTAYLIGAVVGALGFGYLTDRLGRKKLFTVTLAVYLVFTVASALSWSFASLFVFRLLTGLGIGGEYSAINSAIDELIPARVRGWVDLAINGSWWIGTAAGAALTIVLLDPSLVAVNVGWRLCFGLGAILGLAVLLIRRFVPESPRWLMMHGRMDEADRIVKDIERTVRRESDGADLPEPEETIEIRERGTIGFGTIAKTMFGRYPKRAVLGFSLMASQAFFYNAVFFTYALVLTEFYGVDASKVGLFLLPFAVGNFLGPLTLGRLFDTVGRRFMITTTYLISGVLLAVSGWLFVIDAVSQIQLTLLWSVVFFFASCGGSAALLTVSEVFPLEIRAMSIAFFYALATGIGGISGPFLFGALIATGERSMVVIGYLIGAALMVMAGLIELGLGVDAEQRSLEDVARPLSSTDAGGDGERKEDASATARAS